MNPGEFPILEFDPTRRAVIEPADMCSGIRIADHGVICFYKDVVEQVAESTGARVVFEDKGVYGSNRFYQFEHEGQPLVVFQPYVGAPIAAAFLEVAIALGCRKFVVCGGAGVLDRTVPVGRFVVPTAAIRDEGLSYHYAEPSREIPAHEAAVRVITATLDKHGESYRLAKVWTTDAIFRETTARVARRKQEGCLVVDMEAAALMAVAQFRDVTLGYLLFSGDDVSGEEWDSRQGLPRKPIAERLFWLSVEACLRL